MKPLSAGARENVSKRKMTFYLLFFSSPDSKSQIPEHLAETRLVAWNFNQWEVGDA
jgi:hypothetical protein